MSNFGELASGGVGGALPAGHPSAASVGVSLTIANTAIRQDAAGRFCLNDLHRAGGGEARHQPAFFVRRKETTELVDALHEGASADSQTPLATVNDGRNNGTYACRELVIAYAAWISAPFHVRVLRTFDEKVAKPAGKTVANLTRKELLLLALEAEERSERLAIERDQAVATKAEIGSRREATAMATASAAKREAARLKDELGRNSRHATVIAVENATGRQFGSQDWRALKRWCTEHGAAAEQVPDARYGFVKAWPAEAWLAVYCVNLRELFPAAAATTP